MSDRALHSLEEKIELMQQKSEERHLAYQKNDEQHAQALLDLRKTIEDYIKQDTVDKSEAKKWREDATPSIAVMKNLQSWTSTTTILLKTIIVVGTAVGVLYGLWEFISHTQSK